MLLLRISNFKHCRFAAEDSISLINSFIYLFRLKNQSFNQAFPCRENIWSGGLWVSQCGPKTFSNPLLFPTKVY